MDLLKQNRISGKTALVGVMGWPVSHTLSPAMHNAALAAAEINAVYVPLPVDPGQLRAALAGLRALGFIGTNVTIPHKVSVAEAMDDLTTEARLIGAVNTVRVEPTGRLTGHNTDCLGATRVVEQEGTPLAGTTALILGAGGAGRGVAVGAALAGARRVIVLNRSRDKADALIAELKAAKGLPNVAWEAGALEQAHRPDGLPWAEIGAVFQMTSLGMKPGDELPASVQWLSPACHVLEAVYSPLETEFLRNARAKGLRTSDGLSMLLEQGAIAFEFWFGRSPDRQVMRNALLAARG
ncbi:shikimate dehydrogenase [bacterium]|nr:shikimate dehydrogenase [bacterium]